MYAIALPTFYHRLILLFMLIPLDPQEKDHRTLKFLSALKMWKKNNPPKNEGNVGFPWYMYGTYGDLPFPFHLPIQSRLRKLQGRKPTYADPSSRRWLVRTKLCAIRKMFGNKRSIMKQRQINIQSISHRLLFFFLFFVPWCCFALCHCVLYVFVFGCAL